MGKLKRVYEAYKERFPDECGVDNIIYYFDKDVMLYFVLGNMEYNISEDDDIDNLIMLIQTW